VSYQVAQVTKFLQKKSISSGKIQWDFIGEKKRNWGYEALLTMDGLVHGSNLASASSAEKQSLAAWLSIVIPSGNLT
jgi:hypothetical protein